MKRTTRRFKRLWYPTVLLLAVAFCGIAHAANTFEDPKGRFAIDLPSGWKLAPQTDETVYVFKGDDMSIIIEYDPTQGDAGALFAKGVTTLKASGLPNASPAEEIKDLTVNGNNARAGLHADEVAYGSLKVKLYGMLGSVVLKKGGISFLTILGDSSLKKMRGTIETAFHSVRNPGQAVTGAADIKPAVLTAAASAKSAAVGPPGVFEHQYLTLTLPAGWRSQELQPNFEKEIIAWLRSDTIPGASIMASCYRGMGYNHGKVRIGGLKTIAAVYPKGQKMIKEKTKTKTGSGSKAVVEVWQGLTDTGTVMQSPMAVVKTKDCWALMIGYVQDAYGPQLEEDFMKVLESAK
ncbi:MAG TPA: hypothetical protein VN604_01435 [Nitrospirota bacterium]|nr:hypothetical protein [Nitrospirota bacterium]